MRLRAPLLAVALVALAALAGGPRAARAQENPAIQEAVRLAGEGRGDDARRIVAAELAKARPGEPAYVEALFFRARLAAAGDSAERDLRRIAIEYPTSRWADDALLQLAQLAMAAGNPVSAFALAERLRSDYPDSDLRPRAALWAGRAAFDLGDLRGGCALLDSARTEAAGDIEFTNQVGFYRGRCAALPTGPAAANPPAGGAAPPRADTGRAAPAAPSSSLAVQRPPAPAADTARAPARAPASPVYTVQVAAVRTDAEVQRIVRRLQGAGLSSRVQTGADHLRRIHVGSYRTEREALAGVARLKRLLGGKPFVVREP